MASDISELGLSIDARGVTQASSELNKFAGAAKGAQRWPSIVAEVAREARSRAGG